MKFTKSQSKQIVKKIKEERIKRGWNQSDLAIRIGYVPNSISTIETFRRPLAVKLARHIAEAFGWSINKLTDGIIKE